MHYNFLKVRGAPRGLSSQPECPQGLFKGQGGQGGQVKLVAVPLELPVVARVWIAEQIKNTHGRVSMHQALEQARGGHWNLGIPYGGARPPI